MARSPLFRVVRRALVRAAVANKLAVRDERELAGLLAAVPMARRQFLARALASGAALTTAGLLAGCRSDEPAARTSVAGTGSTAPKEPQPLPPLGDSPHVAIVGGGLAGLSCAWHLRKAGIASTIFEASPRIGGRVMSRVDVLGKGLVTEFGGEFIDTAHEDLLSIAADLGLPLIDLQDPLYRADIEDVFYFDGVLRTEAELVPELRPMLERMAADLENIGDVVDYRNHGGAAELDALSISAYLDRIGASGWAREVIEVAYLGEYGLECAEQSALNLLFLIDGDISDGFSLYGESDERFKILGGNQRIAESLAEAIGDGAVRTSHALEAVRGGEGGYTLTFRTEGGSSDVKAELVVLALPFTLLRQVSIDVALPEAKTRAIKELGYGTNAKLMLGFHTRPWKDLGFSGTTYGDTGYQLAWDNSRGQEGTAGGLTIFLGGNAGADRAMSAREKAGDYLKQLNGVLYGVAGASNGQAAQMHWPTMPHALGSYSCYKPGQWTSIAGAESEPVGGLYFAGEHCSYDFQGYMNGAAESGRKAAHAIGKAARA